MFKTVTLNFTLCHILFLCGVFITNNSAVDKSEQKCLLAEFSKTCEENKITFYLYTLGNSEQKLDPLNIKTIEKAPFLNDRKIIFLIHGHTMHKDHFIVKPLRDEYVMKGVNVLVVQYADLSVENCYRIGVENAPVIAKCSTEMLMEIAKHNKAGITVQDFHIIGISLGGQIAGQMSNYLNQGDARFSRITGLDPANEGFYERYEEDNYILTKKDADFVDVIHTNAGFIGKFQTMGHVDFYANSGIMQPGCGNDNHKCNHIRAVVLFLESIAEKIEIRALKYSSLEIKFLVDYQDVASITFGDEINPSKSQGIYFFDTAKTPPYLRERANINYPIYIRHIEFGKPEARNEVESSSNLIDIFQFYLCDPIQRIIQCTVKKIKKLFNYLLYVVGLTDEV